MWIGFFHAALLTLANYGQREFRPCTAWEARVLGGHVSFGEHFDTAHEIEMELAQLQHLTQLQQLAGLGEKVSDSLGLEETEIVDEYSDGDWWAEIVLIQFMKSFHAEQMLCFWLVMIYGHLAGILILFPGEPTPERSKAKAGGIKQYVCIDCNAVEPPDHVVEPFLQPRN
jgi:hypothetical protein